MGKAAQQAAQQAGKALEKVENLESTVMTSVNKTMQKMENTAGSAPSPSGETGGKKTRTMENLNRDELLTVAKRELETAKKLRLQAKASAKLQDSVVQLLTGSGNAEAGSLDAAALSTALQAAWTGLQEQHPDTAAAEDNQEQATVLTEANTARAQLSADLESIR